jgi:hypothetical protein
MVDVCSGERLMTSLVLDTARMRPTMVAARSGNSSSELRTMLSTTAKVFLPRCSSSRINSLFWRSFSRSRAIAFRYSCATQIMNVQLATNSAAFAASGPVKALKM